MRGVQILIICDCLARVFESPLVWFLQANIFEKYSKTNCCIDLDLFRLKISPVVNHHHPATSVEALLTLMMEDRQATRAESAATIAALPQMELQQRQPSQKRRIWRHQPLLTKTHRIYRTSSVVFLELPFLPDARRLLVVVLDMLYEWFVCCLFVCCLYMCCFPCVRHTTRLIGNTK